MSDGISDCASRAELLARKWVKATYPGLPEFNPYHVPTKGKGFVIYETHIDHNLEIIHNHVVVRCLTFKPFADEPTECQIGNDITDIKESIARGSRVLDH